MKFNRTQWVMDIADLNGTLDAIIMRLQDLRDTYAGSGTTILRGECDLELCVERPETDEEEAERELEEAGRLADAAVRRARFEVSKTLAIQKAIGMLQAQLAAAPNETTQKAYDGLQEQLRGAK